MSNDNIVFVFCQNQWLALCEGKLIAVGGDYEEVVSLALAASLF